MNNAAMIAQVILPKHNLGGKKKHNLEFISPIFKNSPPFSCMQKSILNIVVIKNPSETLMTAVSLLSENSSWTTELHIKFRDSWKPHHGPNNAIKTYPGCVMCPWLWTGHSELSVLLPGLRCHFHCFQVSGLWGHCLISPSLSFPTSKMGLIIVASS